LKVAVLFSGDAASVYSFHLSRKAGLEVGYLVTAKAPQSSRMYKSIDPDLTRISVRSLTTPQIEFGADEKDEISPLIEALAPLEIDGLCHGAAASNYRRNRLAKVCQNLNIQLVSPLWHKDPAEMLANMIEEGFEIMISILRADCLNDSWLGRVLDRGSLDDFLQACDKNRISPLGESGEFETFVIAGPDMLGRIELNFEKKWSGNLRKLEITRSRLVR